MDSHKEVYREEAYELLADLEEALLELEQNPDDPELVGRIFRAMHTIKGSGAMFGFDDIAGFTHTIETVFDLVRDGKLSVSKEMISLTLKACDQIKTMLEASVGKAETDSEQIRALTQAFEAYAQQIPATQEPPSAPQGAPPEEETTFRIRFHPHRDLFDNGTNPLPLLAELRDLGEYSIISRLEEIPLIESMDPELCYTFWDIMLTTAAGENAIRDVFIFVDDLSELTITAVDQPQKPSAEKRIGEILVARGDLDEQRLNTALNTQKRIGEVMVEQGITTESEIKSALVEQQHVQTVRKRRQETETASSIRVSSEKLDSLVDLVGELVIVQARLSQEAIKRNDADLLLIAEEVERLSAELRDNAMGIRMLPIGTTFARFKRLVRDLSTELDKDIAFNTDGADTELDKTVIEKLGDPLVHLIRNSIDHGIESPQDRLAAGKPAQGTIHLSAQHSGAYVLIRVDDDGAGLDAERIRAKAIERGLISRDAVLNEKEIFALTLAPGFSTAQNVTNVSGRGVGMDVVSRSIETLGGTIDITSTLGQNTTITLKLPLTLAIIDGLLVNIAQDFFVIPLGTVEECIELTREDIKQTHERHVIRVRDEIIPYINLRELFTISGPRPDIEQIVITDVADQRVGFVVDRVIGEHQTVIKSLGKILRETEGLSGATIMGDGTVALILDIGKLIQLAEANEALAC